MHHQTIRSTKAIEVIQFSDADDRRWSGTIRLAPFTALPWQVDARHDVYVIDGSVTELVMGVPAEYHRASFISRDHACVLTGGADGAILFVYRDLEALGGGSISLPAKLQKWRRGRVAGMTVAQLSNHHHQLILVRWKPGTRAQLHKHPYGEEIYVLEGELQDQRGRYPAGTWQRLYADDGHAPFAEVDTLIMLRNGHLRG